MPEDDQQQAPGVRLSRRKVVQVGYAGVVALVAGAVGVRELNAPRPIGPTSTLVGSAERVRQGSGTVVRRTLTAEPTTVDLGGRTVDTWAFDGKVPAPIIRAKAGDQLLVSLRNRLPDPTTVHWHGIALRNDMDGVPGVTMSPVASGARFDYSFIVPDPGTYWFHPHVGVQLDSGLQGALIIDDPNEPGRYDDEAVLILDDWTDGWGSSPKQILAGFRADGMPAMQEMDMGGISMNGTSQVDPRQPLGQDAGDVTYPAHLINGRLARDPESITTQPGRRVRLRIINAGGDTAYRFSVGGHRLTVTHADGFPVRPIEVDSLILGMGERYDVIVKAGDGSFPIFAVPVGKQGSPALAVLRTSSRRLGDASPPPPEKGRLLRYEDLVSPDSVRLPARRPDKELDVQLTMGDGGRKWLVNGATFADFEPLEIEPNQRVRLNLINRSMMFHPMHLHGHTFALARGAHDGPRKDTVNVLPMAKLSIDLQSDNPGQWLLHCHNVYHGELGMMTVLSYVR